MPVGGTLPEGSLVGRRYRIIRQIGGGAMARVYRAKHLELGTVHALKELCDDSENSNEKPETLWKTAQREAHFLANLSHPSLPKVTDFFRENGRIYLVMDIVEGQDLKTMLDAHPGQPMDVATVVRWGIEVCNVLTYLHMQDPPIIFRDIKPSNLILRSDDGISLVDFGIARYYRVGAPSDTIVFGSPGYAPPEQYGQSQTDARSDIFALGATMHHLLSGRDPSLTPFQWAALSTVNPRVPPPLARLIQKCVEMDASRRPKSAETVRKALRSYLPLVEEAAEAVTTSGIPIDAPLAEIPLMQRTSSVSAPGSVPSRESEEAGRAYVSLLKDVPLPEEPGGGTGALRTEPRILSPLLARLLSPSIGSESMAPVTVPQAAALQAEAAPPPVSDKPPSVAAPPSDPPLSKQAVVQSAITTVEKTPAPLPMTLRPVSLPPLLYRLLRGGAWLVLLGGVTTMALYRPAAVGGRGGEIFTHLAPLRYALDALVCLALFYGVLRPQRPTRQGMMLTMSGILALICLTAATFLPDRSDLFGLIAAFEALTLIPVTMLYIDDLT